MSHHEQIAAPVAAPGFGYETMSPSKRSLLGLTIFPDEIISSEVAEFDAEPARYGSVTAKYSKEVDGVKCNVRIRSELQKNGMLLGAQYRKSSIGNSLFFVVPGCKPHTSENCRKIDRRQGGPPAGWDDPAACAPHASQHREGAAERDPCPLKLQLFSRRLP
jgi:hypothetical protein